MSWRLTTRWPMLAVRMSSLVQSPRRTMSLRTMAERCHTESWLLGEMKRTPVVYESTCLALDRSSSERP